MKKITFLGLLFLFIETKELCEARAKWALILRYTWVTLLITCRYQRQMKPTQFKTAGVLSELYAFQCSQWAPIRNSQIIGRYKEMLPGESYGQWELIRSFVCNTKRPFCEAKHEMASELKIGRFRVNLLTPPIWNCQSTEWTLRFSMHSMRAHLKQSNNRKI